HDTTIFEPHPPSHKQFSLTTETRSGFAARYAAFRGYSTSMLRSMLVE
ncbi:hypothetical protein EDF35_3667, partial [Rathayibacter sp. PhB151]